MSGYGDAWEYLLSEDEDGLDGVTEIAKLDPVRMDAVRVPATGVATLLLIKAIPGPNAADVLASLGYSTRPVIPVPVPQITPRVLKAGEEKRFSLHLAYPAWGLDTAPASDGFKDTISDEQLEQGAWNFLKNGGQIGLFHEDGQEGPDIGRCVESYLWRAGPWALTAADGSSQTIRKGDWLIGIQWSDKPGPGGAPSAWELVKSGRLRGVSMQGYAERKALSPAAAQRIRERRKGNG